MQFGAHMASRRGRYPGRMTNRIASLSGRWVCRLCGDVIGFDHDDGRGRNQDASRRAGTQSGRRTPRALLRDPGRRALARWPSREPGFPCAARARLPCSGARQRRAPEQCPFRRGPTPLVAIRPMRPDDLARETRFATGLSAESQYQRWFSSRRLSLLDSEGSRGPSSRTRGPWWPPSGHPRLTSSSGSPAK